MFDIGVLTHWLRLSPGEVTGRARRGRHLLALALPQPFRLPDDSRSTSRRPPCGWAASSSSGIRSPNWDLKPEFLLYDGHRIPLPDAHVDKIVIYDAFHHVPNQAEILREMARVLKVGRRGRDVRAGRGPRAPRRPAATRPTSGGVLENEFVSEELETPRPRVRLRRGPR